MSSVGALLADLHAQSMRDGEAKLARLLASTWDRRDGVPLVNSGRTAREETTAMQTPFGYTYRAEILCPGCTREAVAHLDNITVGSLSLRGSVATLAETVETTLDRLADDRGIDRMDETTFDSGDFPKVVFDHQVEEHEVCGNCGGEL